MAGPWITMDSRSRSYWVLFMHRMLWLEDAANPSPTFKRPGPDLFTYHPDLLLTDLIIDSLEDVFQNIDQALE